MNESFSYKIKSAQYNAGLAITGCLRGASRERLFQELGLESLAERRWSRRLFFLYKIINHLAPSYLKDVIRKIRELHVLAARTGRFQATFFPYSVSKLNELDHNKKNLPSIGSFKNAILRFIRPSPSPVFDIVYPLGVMLLTRQRIDFSHLREHKLYHNFTDTVDSFCSCRTNSIETTEHYLSQYPNFSHLRYKLFDNLHCNGIIVIPYNGCYLTSILLFGHPSFNLVLTVTFSPIPSILKSKQNISMTHCSVTNI